MNKKITQLRWLAATIMLVAAMVMPSTAWAQDVTYTNGFGSDGSYQEATLTTDKYDIDGDDTKDEVYEIGNAGQLYWFANKVNTENAAYGIANAVLTADITVNKNVLKADGSIADDVSGFRSWAPIGYYNSDSDYADYAGTFDGDNHTISGLYFNESETCYVGLFGSVYNGGCIKNVGVVDSYFNGNEDVGGVCGYAYSSKIENCYNEGTVISIGFNGGVCGRVQEGTISNCYNSGSVTGEWYVGGVCGLIGSSIEDTYIINCYNTGEVMGVKNVDRTGGLCGSFGKAICLNCYNTGTVSAPAGNIGAVFGDYDSDSKFMNCYYLEGCYAEGTSFTNNLGTSMTQGQFGSGEVAYLLSQGSTVVDDKTSTSYYYSGAAWGQQIGTNNNPLIGSPYKVLRAAQDGMEGTNYWATFSNLNSNAELLASTGDVTVYNATVSGGKLTLAKRSDNRVAMEEGVLLKANCEYLNAKNISDEVSAAAIGYNDLVATPAIPQVISETGYKYYRLTYNKVSDKEGLGFYLGVVGDSQDGSQLAATPGKAYLKVATPKVTQVSGTAIRGFAFPGNDGETTGIECITVTDESLFRNGNAEGIFDLQGRKVSKPTKGVYINNGKKVIIK